MFWLGILSLSLFALQTFLGIYVYWLRIALLGLIFSFLAGSFFRLICFELLSLVCSNILTLGALGIFALDCIVLTYFKI